MGANPVAVAVDPGGAEAYADNYYAATVSIIDTAASTSSATGSVTGSIPVGDGPLGIAVSSDGAYAYVANNDDDTVTVIDTTTDAVAGSPVLVGQGPSGIAVSPDGSRVYVANNRDATASVIDTGVSVAGGSATAGLTVSAQQFAVPDGTTADQCPDLAPASIDWPALASLRDQGWHVSWAQWPNAGAGGAVCTRQPYVTGQTWHVRTRS